MRLILTSSPPASFSSLSKLCNEVRQLRRRGRRLISLQSKSHRHLINLCLTICLSVCLCLCLLVLLISLFVCLLSFCSYLFQCMHAYVGYVYARPHLSVFVLANVYTSARLLGLSVLSVCPVLSVCQPACLLPVSALRNRHR